MFRTILWYILLPVLLILFIPKMITLHYLKGKMDDKDFNKLVEEYAANWTSPLIKSSGIKLDLKGAENIPEGAVLFVSNHQSNIDVLLFLHFIRKPKGYISKSELEKIPLLRTWMKHLQCVFMNRSDIKHSLKAILAGIEILKSGHSMVVFPEGTRSKSNEMGDFKPGSFKLATKSLVPIVPVTISGSYKALEANKNKIKPTHVTMTIHPPIHVKDLSKEDLATLPTDVKAIIQSAL